MSRKAGGMQAVQRGTPSHSLQQPYPPMPLSAAGPTCGRRSLAEYMMVSNTVSVPMRTCEGGGQGRLQGLIAMALCCPAPQCLRDPAAARPPQGFASHQSPAPHSMRLCIRLTSSWVT